MSVPAIVTRLVGLWILVGACLKLFAGSPADLPEVLRELPLETGLLFKLAVSAELAIGLLALLRPSRGWLPVKLLTLVFLVVLGFQMARGEESCGCFGAAVTISPLVMLIIDGIAFIALVLVKPWRLARDEGEAPWGITALVILAALSLPWIFDRQTTTHDIATGGGGGGPQWVELKWSTWKGKPLKDTELWPLLGPRARVGEGVIVIWRASCEVCAQHLEKLTETQEGQNPVVLLELPKEFDDETLVVKLLPQGAWVIRQALPEASYIDVTPPLHIEVEDGTVTGVWEGMDTLER